jgi:hypothetical protein
MNSNMHRMRAWLWWLIPFAALALLLGIETDWGRGIQRLPGPAPAIEPKPIAAALLPEYRLEGGLGAHTETVSRTLFNPTRRPAPTLAADAARTTMPKGKFVLTGTAVAGDRHIAFLKEIASGKSRVVRQGEQINGVLVATVAADRVKFTQGDDSEELVLKVGVGPSAAKPLAPPAQGTPLRGGATLPGAVAPAARDPDDAPNMPPRRAVQLPAAPDPDDAPNMPRPAVPAGAATSAVAPVVVPTATSAPAATPAAAQGTPASSDPAWNETFERMRQRNSPPSK